MNPPDFFVPGAWSTCVQLVPSQCSSKGWVVPSGASYHPEAHTSVVETPETPDRPPLLLSGAVGTTVQAVPSQCSASGCALLALPTAHASVGEMASTDARVPARWGLGTERHVVPSQCSMMGAAGTAPPTAQTSV